MEEQKSQPLRHPIQRIIEVPDPDWTYSDRTRRMLQFFRAGIAAYWSVDEENQTIWIYRANWAMPSDGWCPLPEDYEQMVAEWFGKPFPPQKQPISLLTDQSDESADSCDD